MKALVTGSAGFVGYHVCRRLLEAGWTVAGVDNFNAYYDPDLKDARNARLEASPDFRVHRADIADGEAIKEVWRSESPEIVIHLAAQAGVRYSIDHPDAYVASNLVGMQNVLDAARAYPVRHLLAASTSSIYGANVAMPFAETDRVVHPKTLYAATKGANELMGHASSHLFDIPITFFRFFTVYGPWGRPDMALFKFTKAILEDQPIDIFNRGEMQRDFTYVDDLTYALRKLIDAPPETSVGDMDSLSPIAPFRTVNIGGGRPVKLLDFVDELERALGRKAVRNYAPMQPGDVAATHASTDLLTALIGEIPATPLSEGVAAFVSWYRMHYGLPA